MTIFEHIKQLAMHLTPEEKEALSRFLAELRKTGLQPRSLRGIWQDKFPPDSDIDLTLDEIRHEWEQEWPGVFKR
jgi:hypothetical protein